MPLKARAGADVAMQRPPLPQRRIRFTGFILLVVGIFCAAQTQPARAQALRINGPAAYGVHPHHPFLYRVPVVGARPLKFSAAGLPVGLAIEPATGIISGSAPARGNYIIRLKVSNAREATSRTLRLVVGDTLALTPPMGWSSWYMAHTNVSDALIRAQADALLCTGLADHGYEYVNIDDGWNIDPKSSNPAVNGNPRDANGNLRTNANFPDMKALTNYLHARGIKGGIYISPGPRTCAGFEGSYGHERQDAQLFAAWGFDFLKYDLCSYGDILKNKHDAEELKKPYALMGSILKSLDRDFVFNLCEYGLGDVWQWGRQVGGNFWRTTDDVGSGIDGSLWKSVAAYGFGEAGKEKWAGPGGWNDPDNILLGQILWNDKLVATPLRHDEQYTWMSLWSMLSAPLILGSDLTKMDPFTLSLLTNDEVIAVDQDVLGRQAVRIRTIGAVEFWEKPLEGGARAIAIFNRGDNIVSAALSELPLSGSWIMRDLWEHKDLGTFKNSSKLTVPAHGVKMMKLTPAGAR